eukprot:Hpha_TRINITY_DN14962_c0_g1::TRINITY_DN14962_c0_g1_i1::g.143235::m.143235
MTVSATVSPNAKRPGRKLERPIRAAVHNVSVDLNADGKRHGKTRDDLRSIWLQPRRPGELSLRDIAANTRDASPTAPAGPRGPDPLEQARFLSSSGSRRRVLAPACDEGNDGRRRHREAVAAMQVRDYWASRAGKVGAPETVGDSPPLHVARSGGHFIGFPALTKSGNSPANTRSPQLSDSGGADAIPSLYRPRDLSPHPPASAPCGMNAGSVNRSPLKAMREKRVGNTVYKMMEASTVYPYIPNEQPRPSEEYFRLDRALRTLHPHEHKRR